MIWLAKSVRHRLKSTSAPDYGIKAKLVTGIKDLQFLQHFR